MSNVAKRSESPNPSDEGGYFENTPSEITLETIEGEPRIDSRIVAEGLGQKDHARWRKNTLAKYEAKIKRLGAILKEDLPTGEIVWYLNEDQTNFVGTLSRNNDRVVEFKLRLVEKFRDARNELLQMSAQQKVVRACILPTPTPWQKRFSHEYYDQLSRLTGLEAQGNKRPALWGQLTKEFVYDCLPDGVAAGLRQCRAESKGWEKLHQFLSPEGMRIFEHHMRQLLSLMLAASSVDDLRRLMQASITRSYQLLLF